MQKWCSLYSKLKISKNSCLKIYSKASAQGCDNSKNSKIKLKKQQNKKEENRPTKYREIFDSFCEGPLFE